LAGILKLSVLVVVGSSSLLQTKCWSRYGLFPRNPLLYDRLQAIANWRRVVAKMASLSR
jgi:hypothetical protein